MWDIQLGHTEFNTAPEHWELIFRFDEKAQDESMECRCPHCECEDDCQCPPCDCGDDCCPFPPCDCEDDCSCPRCPNCRCRQFDDDNFSYDENEGRATAHSIIHVSHMRTSDATGHRWFERLCLEHESALIICTPPIGTFTNLQLSTVESICANIRIPETGYGNSQTWIHEALIAIDVAGAAELEDYEHTLNEVFLRYELCDECGEAAEETNDGDD